GRRADHRRGTARRPVPREWTVHAHLQRTATAGKELVMRADPVTRFVLSAIVGLCLSSPATAALVTLTGKVTDPNGLGVFGVTVNFVDSCTGVTAGAINNVTSSTGSFQAAVNPGIYDLEFSPPSGSLFAAQRILHFDLTTSRTLANLVLQFGII